jgi:hypothetical protein
MRDMKSLLLNLLCVAIALPLLSGCVAGKLRKNSNQLEVGMTIEEVTAIMGKPFSKSAEGNTVRILYGKGWDLLWEVVFVDGKAVSF